MSVPWLLPSAEKKNSALNLKEAYVNCEPLVIFEKERYCPHFCSSRCCCLLHCGEKKAKENNEKSFVKIFGHFLCTTMS